MKCGIKSNFRDVKNVNTNFVGCAVENGTKSMAMTNTEPMKNVLCMMQKKKPKMIRLGKKKLLNGQPTVLGCALNWLVLSQFQIKPLFIILCYIQKIVGS